MFGATYFRYRERMVAHPHMFKVDLRITDLPFGDEAWCSVVVLRLRQMGRIGNLACTCKVCHRWFYRTFDLGLPEMVGGRSSAPEPFEERL